MLQEVGQARPPQPFIAFPTELQFLSIIFTSNLCECARHFPNELICYNYDILATTKVPQMNPSYYETTKVVGKHAASNLCKNLCEVDFVSPLKVLFIR